MLKDLVAIVDNGDKSAAFVQRAIGFAKAQEAHFAITLLTDIFWDPAMLPPYDAYSGVFDEIEAEQSRRIAAVKALVEHAPIAVEVRAVTDAPAYLNRAASIEGRYADMLLVGGPSAFENPKLRRRSVEAALMSSTGPILILPDDSQLERVRHVVLGWDASAEARRAAKDLLPVLDPGAHIDIVAVDALPSETGHGPSPGTDIARHLARHGFDVEVHQQSSVGRTVSGALEEFTASCGADLLAIGAFAHSRVRDIFLGGVTRHLLQDVRMPLMLSR
jgi:nucleotide-binding universal stress UspA family protein